MKKQDLQPVYFISGIDTDAGKSYVTAYIAKKWIEEGHSVITQKFIQTGNVGHSEDIDLHRKLMGIPFTKEDKLGLTMPEIFSYPASPELASRIDKRPVDLKKIENATHSLMESYDCVLLEGAGGLMVPITKEYLTIDYIQEHNLPLIFVTSGKLGSVNHTLLSLEAIKSRNLPLAYVAYNMYPQGVDTTIQEDTLAYIKWYLAKHFPETKVIEVPIMK